MIQNQLFSYYKGFDSAEPIGILSHFGHLIYMFKYQIKLKI